MVSHSIIIITGCFYCGVIAFLVMLHCAGVGAHGDQVVGTSADSVFQDVVLAVTGLR